MLTKQIIYMIYLFDLTLLQHARFVDENGNVCVSKKIKNNEKIHSQQCMSLTTDFELTDEQIIEHENSLVHLDQHNVYNEALAIMKRSVKLAVGDEESIKYYSKRCLKLEGERHVTTAVDNSLIISANSETKLKQHSTSRLKPCYEN